MFLYKNSFFRSDRPARAEDSTENGRGSKRCEFQGSPNLFYFMCLFIKPVIFGTAKTCDPNQMKVLNCPEVHNTCYRFRSQLNPLFWTQNCHCSRSVTSINSVSVFLLLALVCHFLRGTTSHFLDSAKVQRFNKPTLWCKTTAIRDKCIRRCRQVPKRKIVIEGEDTRFLVQVYRAT